MARRRLQVSAGQRKPVVNTETAGTSSLSNPEPQMPLGLEMNQLKPESGHIVLANPPFDAEMSGYPNPYHS